MGHNLVDSTMESWSLGLHCRGGWHKFSKMEGQKSHLPYSCQELPHSQTEWWGSARMNTAFSWLTCLCLFLTKVFRGAEWATRTRAGGREKLTPICSYPDIAWEHTHIRQLWISLGIASLWFKSHSLQFSYLACLQPALFMVMWSTSGLDHPRCVYLPHSARAVERGKLWQRSGERGDNPKLCSRESSSLRCCPKAKKAVYCPQLPFPRGML